MRRNLKRNIVIAAVLVFVGAAVYLNWSYNSRWGNANAAMVAAEDAAMEEAETEYLEALAEAEEASVTTSAYFDEARLSRQSSRDEALELLELACSADDTTQEVIDASMEQINAIAAWNLQEALVENELLAKGYEDCIVFASDDGITVAVPAALEGLTDTQVAQITEAVLSNTDYAATELNIIAVTS